MNKLFFLLLFAAGVCKGQNQNLSCTGAASSLKKPAYKFLGCEGEITATSIVEGVKKSSDTNNVRQDLMRDLNTFFNKLRFSFKKGPDENTRIFSLSESAVTIYSRTLKKIGKNEYSDIVMAKFDVKKINAFAGKKLSDTLKREVLKAIFEQWTISVEVK